MAVNKVNNDTFAKLVLNNGRTVLVDFYADWCGPCKMLSPIVDQIADENSDFDVYKLNVDEAPEIAAKYGVMSIPTLIVFKNGQAVGKTIGVQSKQTILNMLG
ncbi:MAG: thioredoxin [Clostridia bacterium]|nr:thioredoxin [Clostridia bacterium]MDD6040611.1 thioredoxin [Clostridia bacterium]